MQKINVTEVFQLKIFNIIVIILCFMLLFQLLLLNQIKLH